MARLPLGVFVVLMRVRVSVRVAVIVRVVAVIVDCVPVVVVVHQFFRDIWEQFARGRRAAASPLHASLFARGGEEIVPG